MAGKHFDVRGFKAWILIGSLVKSPDDHVRMKVYKLPVGNRGVAEPISPL